MRVALFALLAFGCRIDLDKREEADGGTDQGRECRTTTVPVCVEAEAHSDFQWIQDNIFSTNCSGDSCHGQPTNGSPPSGRLVLATGVSYETLMGANGTGVMSELDPNKKLVNPGSPDTSYLHFIMKGVPADAASPAFEEPPASVGYMPMNNSTLCCQKLDAIGRWIAAGAMP